MSSQIILPQRYIFFISTELTVTDIIFTQSPVFSEKKKITGPNYKIMLLCLQILRVRSGGFTLEQIGNRIAHAMKQVKEAPHFFVLTAA